MSETATDRPMSWTAPSSGAFDLTMSLDEAMGPSHQGQCDEDVRALSETPHIAGQLAAIDPATLAAELREYGVWDSAELADHAQNLQRVLWIAASDIREEPDLHHAGHYSRIGGTYWCDTCDSPYCELA